MRSPVQNILKALVFLPVLFLFSCASYNQQAAGFYTSLEKGDFEKASKSLDHNRLLKKNRNRLLYLLEKGKVEHLRGNYKESNRFFEEADLLMESTHASLKDLAAGTLINPMMETYRGEDFEKYMVHYYKAINYLHLHELEDALVEARRISLRTQAQEDVRKNGRYSGDAFSHMLQGLIYEAAGDINNAFIAYRNAVDLYLDHQSSFYGTPLPLQLKKDLLRSAYLNGFTDELERYERLLEMQFDAGEKAERSVVVFVEGGLAPVKKQQQLFFSLYDDGGDYYFRDQANRYKVPFDRSQYASSFDPSKINSIRIALPRYESRNFSMPAGSVTCNGVSFPLEQAQNINEIAIATLKERWLLELSKSLTRLAVKKLAEEAAKPKDDEKDKSKKSRQEALTAGLKLFTLASEKADTRNWQSLPHSIYYVRIPLKAEDPTVSIRLSNGIEKQVEVSIRPGLHFAQISTLN